MKKIITTIVLSLLVLYILIFPEAAIAAASRGLVLWYTTMLPTLLPFAILSHILIATGLLNTLTDVLHRGCKGRLLVSRAGIYPLFAGFLFGFPMGSRITAQLVEEGQMDISEGNRLFSVCNNIGPVFINGYLLDTSLHRPDLNGITLAILYLPPLICLVIDSRLTKRQNSADSLNIHFSMEKKAAPRSQMNFKIIDAGIMSGFETLTRLGGYIMMFAILAQMAACIPLPGEIPVCLLIGITEITNGIAHISNASLSFGEKYLLMIACTAFGGLSGLAQTASMTGKVGFSMRKYLKTKLFCSIASLGLAFLALRLLI